MEPHSKGGVSRAWSLPLSERRPSWLQQGGHYFFRLSFLSLLRKSSNAITKLPKAISKPIIPMNIKIISAAAMTPPPLLCIPEDRSLSPGGYHTPVVGSMTGILPYSDRYFNIMNFGVGKVTVLFFNIILTSQSKKKDRKAL